MHKESIHPLVSAGEPRVARMPLERAHRWLAEREPGEPRTQVFLTQTTFQAIDRHANSDLDNEVGGWLAGRWCCQPGDGAQYIIIEALLPAQQVRSGSTFLTFTHDSQVAMLAALEERYANKCIVGWYHTHPRMDIFLSGYDLWLHQHFFPHPWQVALVVEPHSHTAGFFIPDAEQQLEARRFYGFHELMNRKRQPLVDWKNLRLQSPAQDAKDDPSALVQPAALPATSAKRKPSQPQGQADQPSTEKEP
ncbi:MAG: Mov34/MPN/PAD-1 family protein [Anaerolineales bacterium]|nr:Mov34/MPN/PAD-1 family protein [Anaerolineales bacterium]